MGLKLYYTPRSHYARKVRVLLDAWGEEVELIDAGNVADLAVEGFGGNPLQKVPALVDGEVEVIDSDHIAAYLVRRLDPQDRYRVLDPDVVDGNARAVLNGVMAAEVEWILAKRSGLEPAQQPRFQKHRDVIRTGLAWCEGRAELFEGPPRYLGFHLVCAWEHLERFGPVPLDYPRLAAHVARLAALPFVAKSRPPQ